MKMKKLTEARIGFGFTNMWTQDGKILCKEDKRIKGFFLTNCVQSSPLEVFLKNSCKTHNFSGVLKNVCRGVCFSSFFVNLQANKLRLCWKDICYTVIFQGICEFIFKLLGGTCLFGAHSSEWLLPGCGKCTDQEPCVNICAKEGNIFLFVFG